MQRSWLALGLAAMLAVAGCHAKASPTPTPTPLSVVQGRVLLNGGPALLGRSPTPWPYPASKVTAIDSAGRPIATVKARPDGSYRLELPPGTFTLKARPTAGNPWFAPRKVSVRAGRLVHVDLVAQVP